MDLHQLWKLLAHAPTNCTVLTLIGNDVVDKPCCCLFGWILVAVDFLLLESPIGELFGVGPHRHPCWDVDKSEVPRLTLPGITLTSAKNVKMEECVIVTRVIAWRMGGEFLIGGHQG